MLTPLDTESAGPSTANDFGSKEADFWDNFEAHEGKRRIYAIVLDGVFAKTTTNLESYKAKTTEQLSPSTEKQKQNCEELLFQFTEQYLKKKNSSITVDDFLRERPPNPFWKTFLRFLATSPSNMKYSKNGYTKIRDSYTTSTVRLQMSICLTLYKRFFGVAADPEQVQACWNLLKIQLLLKKLVYDHRKPKNGRHLMTASILSNSVFSETHGSLRMFASAYRRQQWCFSQHSLPQDLEI
jgi:hypothetical protein